jgi:hypothetical protein
VIQHFLLFLGAALPIVIVGSLVANADDESAFKQLPRRLTVFVVSCAVLLGAVLLAESTFASLG